jgi:hypothetical protein
MPRFIAARNPSRGASIREVLFVWMALVEKQQCALKELIDFLFADFMRGEQTLKVEFRKPAAAHFGRKKFPQAAGFDGSQRADFFEHHAPQRILKNNGIEQFADFRPRSTFDQHGTKEPQRISLEVRPVR